MSDLLRAFGVLTLVGGLIVAGFLVIAPWADLGRVPMEAGLLALAWVLGSAFWAALCITTADTHKEVRTLREELQAATGAARRAE